MGASAAIVASIGLTAVQTASQMQAQKAQAKYQQQIYAANERMGNLRADDAIARGDQDASTVKKQTKRLVGSQRAALAAQGIDVGSGSALDVQEETDTLGELDALTVKNNAFREAWGYKAEALDNSARAAFSASASKTERRNTLLTGGLQALTYGIRGTGRSRSRNGSGYSYDSATA